MYGGSELRLILDDNPQMAHALFLRFRIKGACLMVASWWRLSGCGVLNLMQQTIDNSANH
jgi:hypothetical protein